MISHQETLLHNILNKKQIFSSLNSNDQKSVRQLALETKNEDFFRSIISEYTPIFDFNERSTYWLDSDFYDDVWKLKLTNECKEIKWNEVILSDGERLTNNIHKPLLNAFKLWVLATDNPRVNGGRTNSKSTISQNINRVILLINAILLNGESIELTQHHLSKLNFDIVMSIIVKIAKNGSTAVYDFPTRLKLFILNNTETITTNEAKNFKKKYPYVLRSIPVEEQELKLTVEDRIKACCFLKKEGFYHGEYIPQPNNTALLQYLLKGKIICSESSNIKQINELFFKEANRNTEFSAVPIQNDSNIYSENGLAQFIKCFKLLSVTNQHTESATISANVFKNISLRYISLHAELKGRGRYLTLPAGLVFKAMENAFHFCFEYMDDILDSVYKVLMAVSEENNMATIKKDKRYTNTMDHTIWKKNKCKDYISQNLIELGIESYSICINKGDIFSFLDLRKNKGLVEIYSILLGSAQILAGATMARRQDEFVQLKPNGNLSHNTDDGSIKSDNDQFIDPTSEEGQELEYSLTFNNKKSGIGGEFGQNESETRPIPQSIAGFIYKLEQFNKKVLNTSINTSKGLSLFNTLSIRNFALSKLTVGKFNSNINLFCDYFETDCIKYGDEIRRYYIREHQLRRFFAMVFFWSKSFDGLDTLRWMLGHTDMEHLYHYVTETHKGEALNGIKASYLTDKFLSQDLDDIDLLRKAISKRFGTEAANVYISTTTEAIETFDATEFETQPPMAEFKKQAELEDNIYTLLQDDIITLEPEFFTIKSSDGKVQNFNLILQVKELD